MRLQRADPRPPGDLERAWALVAAAVLLAARWVPWEAHPLVLCPLRTFAHLPCPTCGMTRAFARMAHGAFGSAWEVNPLGLLVALAAAGWVLWIGARLTVLPRPLPITFSPAERRGAVWMLVACVGANWWYLIHSGAPLR